MGLQYTQMPTTEVGLEFRPTLGTVELDSQDWIEYEPGLSELHKEITVEFSDSNKAELVAAMTELKHDDLRLNAILEIGVFRSGEVSSTRVILNTKHLTTKYVGVDLNEWCLSPIRDAGNNVFCLAENSSNIDRIMAFAKQNGVGLFDLILIDGYHSVSQVLDDWRFVRYLRQGGYVLMHDTNYHPGPKAVFDAIDESMFQKRLSSSDTRRDWGLGIAKKL